jgi:hypothetical protein
VALPLLRVSLSGVGRGGLLVLDRAWTLPVAWRVLGSAFGTSVEPASFCR